MRNDFKQNMRGESVMIDGLKKLLFCQLLQIKEEYQFSDRLYELAKNFFFLAFENNLIPKRITDLHEDGYSFLFMKNNEENVEIWFEIYPDCEFGYIAFDKANNYRMLANEDITDFNDFIEFMLK